jgi:hypothetical protein
MYINRITYKVKRGAIAEMVKLSKVEIERTRSKATVYTAYFGPRDVVVFDFEFESLEAYQKFWNEWVASPEGDEFMKKFNTLLESGGSNELWYVE